MKTHCPTCNIPLRNKTLRTFRTCPNPRVIQEYLLSTGYQVEIPEGSMVCYTCYRSHLQILKKPLDSIDADLITSISDFKRLHQYKDHG